MFDFNSAMVGAAAVGVAATPVAVVGVGLCWSLVRRCELLQSQSDERLEHAVSASAAAGSLAQQLADSAEEKPRVSLGFGGGHTVSVSDGEAEAEDEDGDCGCGHCGYGFRRGMR